MDVGVYIHIYIYNYMDTNGDIIFKWTQMDIMLNETTELGNTPLPEKNPRPRRMRKNLQELRSTVNPLHLFLSTHPKDISHWLMYIIDHIDIYWLSFLHYRICLIF